MKKKKKCVACMLFSGVSDKEGIGIHMLDFKAISVSYNFCWLLNRIVT